MGALPGRTAMFRIPKNVPALVVVVAVGFLIGFDGEAQAADNTLHLYGPSGASPAIREAAIVFEGMRDVHVDIVSGPAETWIDRARENADLVYSGAEFLMAEWARDEALGIDQRTITPLYLRSSIVFARPGNPHEIKEFSDLLEPGLRIMIVNPSGELGLWEDMAEKLKDVRTFRTLRRNISVFAVDSDEAVKVWKTSPEIDVWITWDIWFTPLRDQAEMITLGEDHQVPHQCGIALTRRGMAKSVAQEFVDFLVSRHGVDIFASWGWDRGDNAYYAIAVPRDICAVCKIEENKEQQELGEGLVELRGLLKDYADRGVSPERIHICAVFTGGAAQWLLNDQQYAKVSADANPNRQLVRELAQLGVSIELSSQTIEANGWGADDLLPEVKVVPGEAPRIADLQNQGFAYLKF